jgi:hypothetical protein
LRYLHPVPHTSSLGALLLMIRFVSSNSKLSP